ncbi:putative Uncharacterized 39.9 kDa protein in amylase 3'region [Exiguobacterium sp. 8H]|uniref:DUF418 domain-containing protein n=1 Tax=unclassified Exiguobacterium TaxID=2644629 RepID=UPI0012F30240|nr:MULTISPECIES: DUF418 domain-containing protein [unclassified Exiguobacterium]VXB94970.1 putative Uncharacterized 39.9 kDa protein in amylase 3'region [Exiguobacterium sp. 8H]VXC15092.1 conserved membrane hypothetical protein [Exiguobacterium sp. 8A]
MAGPIQTNERIILYDIIRGFALCGIFLVNIPTMLGSDWMSGRPDYAGSDLFVRTLFDLFVQTKFYTIFSLLFGIGFSIFLERSYARGESVSRYIRRIAILFLFGLAHLAIWSGDILHTYAMWGLLLPLFYGLSNRAILTWAWSLLIGSFLLFYVSSMYLELSLGFRFNGDPFPAVFNSGFGPWFDYRLDEEIFAMFQNSFFVGVEILSLFLFGLYIGRERKLLTWSIQGLTQTAIICTVTALPFFAVIIWHHYGNGAEYSATNSAAVLVSGKLLATTYVCLFTVAVRKGRTFAPLQALGRMALTNYLTHTLIVVIPVIALGAYGSLSLTEGLFLSIAILIVQSSFSMWWLKSHRYGPFEKLWRLGTYGRQTKSS